MKQAFFCLSLCLSILAFAQPGLPDSATSGKTGQVAQGAEQSLTNLNAFTKWRPQTIDPSIFQSYRTGSFAFA
jgi:hypothetical protein